MRSIIATIFGILGLISTILIYQQRENRHLLVYKILTDLLFIVHYTANGNTAVVAVTWVAVLRSIVLLNRRHAWARHPCWFPIFMGLSVLFSIFGWQDLTSLLTAAGSLLCITAYFLCSPRMTRILSIPASLLFLINVCFHFSLWGVLCECFILVSAIVGILRLDLPGHPTSERRSNAP